MISSGKGVYGITNDGIPGASTCRPDDVNDGRINAIRGV